MPVISGEIARHIVDPVFRAQLFFSDCGRALHFLLVAFKERNLMFQSGKFMNVQLAIVGAFEDSFRLCRTIAKNIAVREVVIPVSVIRIEFDGLLSLLLGPIELTDALRNLSRQKTMGHHIAGITLNPQITGLPRLFEIAQNLALIKEVDEIPLQVAGVVSQFPTVYDFLLGKSARQRYSNTSSRRSCARLQIADRGKPRA